MKNKRISRGNNDYDEAQLRIKSKNAVCGGQGWQSLESSIRGFDENLRKYRKRD